MVGCGVLGIVLKDGAEGQMTEYAKRGMNVLNHRGPQACGIAYLDEFQGILRQRRFPGLVKDSKMFANGLRSGHLLGHTRYATSSSAKTRSNIQPIAFRPAEGIHFAIAHNGNIANDAELKAPLRNGRGVKEMSDTRVLGLTLAQNLRMDGDEIASSLKKSLEGIVGSYSIALLVAGTKPSIIATRDKFGYMPLCFGENKHGYFVASESVAFGIKYLNADYKEIKPGEIIVMEKHGYRSYQLFESPQIQPCMFQFVYMCRPETVFAGVHVYEARERLGIKIAQNYRPDVDCIVGIPDSGTAASYGYIKASGMPPALGLVKDRYESGRAFMGDNNEHRKRTVSTKLNIDARVVQGKRILLIDDSLVRGITLKQMTLELRAAGAAEIHIALACPPIISQCFYGVDIYNEQLAARPLRLLDQQAINSRMAKVVGADSLYYTTLTDLMEAIGLQQNSLCVSCLTGKYMQNVTFQSAEERRVQVVQPALAAANIK